MRRPFYLTVLLKQKLVACIIQKSPLSCCDDAVTSVAVQASHTRMLIQVLAIWFPSSCLLIRLGWEQQVTQGLGLCHPMASLDGVVDYWCQRRPVLVTAAIWGINKQMVNILSLYISFCLLNKQLNC